MRKPLTLTVDAWGNVIVARHMGMFGTYVAKLDKDGKILWEQTVAPQTEAHEVPDSVPPMAFATEESRDSVEPVLMDAELDQLQRELIRPSGLKRGLGVAALLAGLFAFGMAGGAAYRQSGLRAAAAGASPAQAGLLPSVTMLAADAVASAETPTVDDTPGSEDTSLDEPEATLPEEALDAAEAPAAEAPPEPVAASVTAPIAAKPVEVEAAPVAKPTEPDATPASAEAAAPVTAASLRQDTLALLNSGKMNEAAVKALQLVEAAPSDAFSYLCLGAAQQAQGRIAEAATAYRTCAQYAKHGDVAECRALAGM